MTPKSELRQAHEQVQCVTGTATRIVALVELQGIARPGLSDVPRLINSD